MVTTSSGFQSEYLSRSIGLRNRIFTLKHDEGWTSCLTQKLISLIDGHVFYRALCQGIDVGEKSLEILTDYLNLSVDVLQLYRVWEKVDPLFSKKSVRFEGIRILRQDPWEALVCFICSSNNNIARITQMVEKLCVEFGDSLGQLPGSDYIYHNFPSIKTIAHACTEGQLRNMGFGYRAKFLQKTAALLANERPLDWLNSLRESPMKSSREQLLQLHGVGRKVADCVVCLMSRLFSCG